jgi:hypothetical protein
VKAAKMGTNRRVNKTGTFIEYDVVAGVEKNVESKEVKFFEMDVESIILSIRNKGENVRFGLKTTTMDVAIMIMDKATTHRVRT